MNSSRDADVGACRGKCMSAVSSAAIALATAVRNGILLLKLRAVVSDDNDDDYDDNDDDDDDDQDDNDDDSW